jgi:hypothetical protein
MILKLTPEQRQAFRQRNGETVRLEDDETSRVYVVVEEATHREAMDALHRERALEAVRRGVQQMEAGLGRLADAAEADLRQRLGFPPAQ